ncbi:MFS transporter [Kribbella sp. NPDC051936]|uniref:MFS transporter n=1 Tax=Kribbella sp. NPDC051936 TaxID=3154946 RepID=UPI003445A557
MVHSTAQPPAAARSLTARQAAAVAVLACAQLMLVLDVTVVNVALPDIASDLDLGRSATTWVMTAYTTLFGGLVLVGGRIADLLGARRVLALGMVLFATASLASALAPGAATLLAGRSVQGIAAALLSPAALAVLLGQVSGAGRGRALAIWGSLSAVGTAVGVSLGGVLTSTLGWQWIFAINVPIAVGILIALPIVTSPVAASPARLDLTGAALVTVGTASIVYGLVGAGTVGWTDPLTLLSLAAGIALWIVFGVVESRTKDPVLRVALLAERPVVAGVLLMVVATGLMVGNFFIGSFALQRAYGDGPLRVGLEFLPVAFGVGFGAHLAGHVLERVPARSVATAGLVLAAAGEATVLLAGSGRAVLVAGVAIAALGIGAVFVTAFTSALATAGAAEGGTRSAVVSTAHELGGAFGVAVLSTIAGAALTAAHPAPESFDGTFAVAAVVAAVAAVIAVPLVPAVRRTAAAPHH